MVFPTISDFEPSAATNPVASIKSHPLHNFSFTGPTWSAAHPRFRRQSADSTHRAINDLPPVPAGNTVHSWEEEDRGQRPANGRSNKVQLRLRKKEKPTEPPVEATVAQVKVPASPEQPDELTPKVWNLRPRKPISKKSSTRQMMMGERERVPWGWRSGPWRGRGRPRKWQGELRSLFR